MKHSLLFQTVTAVVFIHCKTKSSQKCTVSCTIRQYTEEQSVPIFFATFTVLKYVPALQAHPIISILAKKHDKLTNVLFNSAFTVQNVPSWGLQ